MASGWAHLLFLPSPVRQYCNPWEFMHNQLITDPSKLIPINRYFRSISCSCCFWQGRKPLLFALGNSPCHTNADLGFVSSGMTDVLNIYKPLITLSHLLSVLACFPFIFSETVQQLLALFLGAMHLQGLDFSCVHKGSSVEVGGALLVDPHLMMQSPVPPPEKMLVENLFVGVWFKLWICLERLGSDC